MNKEVEERNKFIAYLVADDIEEKLQSYRDMVESAARDPGVREAVKHPDAAKLQKEFHERLEAQGKPKPKRLWVADRDGRILAMDDPQVKLKNPSKSYRWRGWFNGEADTDQGALAEPTQWTHISRHFVLETTDPSMVIAISTPVRDPDDDNQIVGVVAVAIAFECWTSFLDLPESFAVILNKDGTYLAHREKELIKPDRMPATFPASSPIFEEVLHASKPGKIETPFTDPLDNKTYVGCYAPLNNRKIGRDLGWVVLIQQEQKSAATTVEKLNKQMLEIGLWALGVMGVLLPALWAWLIWMLRREEGYGHA